MPKSTAGRRIIHITDRLERVISRMGLGDPSDWVFMNLAGRQVAESKTLARLKRYAVAAGVLVEPHPRTKDPWSLVRWHWLRHYHRTRAHVSQIRREVSKMAMGHAADAIHDHYRRVDSFAFHEEYAKFDSGLKDNLFKHPNDQPKTIEANDKITQAISRKQQTPTTQSPRSPQMRVQEQTHEDHTTPILSGTHLVPDFRSRKSL